MRHKRYAKQRKQSQSRSSFVSQTRGRAEQHSVSGMPRLLMDERVYEQIRSTIGGLPAEHGGPIGGVRQDDKATHFYFDGTSTRSNVTYTPDHATINRLFKEVWNPAGINLLGFVHSHPDGFRRPSGGDIEYAQRILEHIPDLDRLWLPIVMSEPTSGAFEILPYAFVRDENGGHIEEGEIVKFAEETAESVQSAVAVNLAVVKQMRPTKPKRGKTRAQRYSDPAPSPAAHQPDAVAIQTAPVVPFDLGETFKRVEHAYDLPRMATSRLVIVGAGGAAAFVEDMARAGVGEFILIDPDVVSETNLATQQVYRRDIGRTKVECIEDRIHDINPRARVVALSTSLDELCDEELEYAATAPFDEDLAPSAVTLMCGFTDNFFAQARVNRLALQFGLPSLSAQVYFEGRGAEVVFTYPGVTKACQRCILSRRYKAFLEDGYQNDVTSDGTPIFATTRLNAIKGFVALAMLHHGTTHPRWGSLLERIGDRNLIQIRMDPDLAATVGLKTFDRALGGADQNRILFDEAVWLPQKPENPDTGYPPCPDCGGSGNLLDARGHLYETWHLPVSPRVAV